MKTILTLVAIAVFAFMLWLIDGYSTPERNDVTLRLIKRNHVDTWHSPVRLAVLSDIHVKDDPHSYKMLEGIVDQILGSNPDFVLLLGDYTHSSVSSSSLPKHRRAMAGHLSRLAKHQTLAVLGNHETWTNPEAWKEALSSAGLSVLENAVLQLDSNAGEVCFRGLGDFYTGRFRYVDFPRV